MRRPAAWWVTRLRPPWWRRFNLPATTLLLVAMFLFALTIFSGMSWLGLMDRVGELTLATWQRIGQMRADRSETAPEQPVPSRNKARTAAPAQPEKRVEPEPPLINDRVEPDEDAASSGWLQRILPERRAKQEVVAERREPVIADGRSDGAFSATRGECPGGRCRITGSAG